MAKKESSKDPDPAPATRRLPDPPNAPKENVNVDPLNPPPPKEGGKTPGGKTPGA